MEAAIISVPPDPQPTAMPITAPFLKLESAVAVGGAHSVFSGEPQSAALPMKAGTPND